ncbi:MULTISPECIES: GNAT family N-acetyltransferase [unclassified Streptomyces]|uniref:GNAT family N-acetyltransferase n=1 Tax=unclassified Streptomyces TaxID=2593676 RepID=UPI002E3683B7|nr:GNAT family N-acetyltransferase [Streptomyces sp. NBC_01280]
MDHQAVLSRFDRQMRRNAEPDGPGGRVERVDGVVRQTGAEVGSWNGVVWSDLDENSADAAIAAQVRHFTELGREFEWKVYGHDLPHDLPQRLTAAGFVPEPVETLLVAEVADLPTDVPPPGGIRLLPVTDETGVDLMSQVHDKAFGRSLGLTRQQLLAQLAEDPDAAPAVLALAGDVPVSAARMETHPGTDFASLWGGGTVAEWRGRGIYRSLVAFRTRIAAERGYRYLQVDASSMSRPILERLGFTALSTTTPYVHGAAGGS